MALLDVVVGRQPVFDRELAVVGYELLFRALQSDGRGRGQLAVRNEAPQAFSGDLMTSTVLFSSVSIGINRLVGDKVVFCNADRGLLLGLDPVVLPADRTVIEVDASMAADEEVLEGCHRLVQQGFTLAVDHVTRARGIEPLLELASLVKIDLRVLGEGELPELIARCRQFDAGLVAEFVETPEQLSSCRDLGFDFFQGYLLSRPRVVPGRTIDSASLARLQLAAALVESECSADQLEEIIRSEPSMAYQLLQMAGVGADHGLRRNVRTLREALVICGWRQLQGWISFLLVTHHGETSLEEIVTALQRARMCELLAGVVNPVQSSFAFTAGMLSSFDLLLALPIEEVLISLPLDDDLHEAILRRDTEVGRIVADVIDHQLGRPEEAVRSGINEKVMHGASMNALTWAIEVSKGFVRESNAPVTAPHLRPALH